MLGQDFKLANLTVANVGVTEPPYTLQYIILPVSYSVTLQTPTYYSPLYGNSIANYTDIGTISPSQHIITSHLQYYE